MAYLRLAIVTIDSSKNTPAGPILVIWQTAANFIRGAAVHHCPLGSTTNSNSVIRAPWNKGKLVGQKLPFKLKEIWAIRSGYNSLFVGANLPCSIWPLTASVGLAISLI